MVKLKKMLLGGLIGACSLVMAQEASSEKSQFPSVTVGFPMDARISQRDFDSYVAQVTNFLPAKYSGERILYRSASDSSAYIFLNFSAREMTIYRFCEPNSWVENPAEGKCANENFAKSFKELLPLAISTLVTAMVLSPEGGAESLSSLLMEKLLAVDTTGTLYGTVVAPERIEDFIGEGELKAYYSLDYSTCDYLDSLYKNQEESSKDSEEPSAFPLSSKQASLMKIRGNVSKGVELDFFDNKIHSVNVFSLKGQLLQSVIAKGSAKIQPIHQVILLEVDDFIQRVK